MDPIHILHRKTTTFLLGLMARRIEICTDPSFFFTAFTILKLDANNVQNWGSFV